MRSLTFLLIQPGKRRSPWLARLLHRDPEGRFQTGESFEFADSTALSKKKVDWGETEIIFGPAKAESAEIRSLLRGIPNTAGNWLAEDLAYCFGQPQPGADLDSLEALAREAVEQLAELPDELLAHVSSLVVQNSLPPVSATARLGFFETELNRRFDVLSMPSAGELDIETFAPRKKGAGSLSKQEVPPDLLERLFKAREALRTAFDNYEERPQQQEMLQVVDSALSGNRNAVVEAGTGVGKSLAYLLPLALHSARSGKLCLVSTNTINLQQQLMELDIPRVRRLLDSLDLRVALLKGREHYLCLKRLEDTWLKDNQQARVRRDRQLLPGLPALKYLIRILLSTANYPLGDLDAISPPADLGQRERAELQAGLDCRFQTCLGDRCEHRGRCHYFAKREEALRSNIAVTNHALVFALHSPEETDPDNLVSKASAIVFDEAHNLESAITNQQTLEVSDKQPVDLGNRLLELLQNEHVAARFVVPESGVGENLREAYARVRSAAGELPAWIKLMAAIRAQVISLLEQAADKGAVSPGESTQISPSTAEGMQPQVLHILGKLASRLNAVMEKYSGLIADLSILLGNEQSDMFIDDDTLQMELKALLSDIQETRTALSQWRPEEPGAITWFNCDLRHGEPQWEFKTAPLKVGPVFQSLVSDKESVVLCSATLSVAGQFDYLQESLGYNEEARQHTDWVRLESPFDYARNAQLLVATDMDPPTGARRESYLKQLEDVIAGVAEIFERGVLVLFNSYRDLTHTAQQLSYRIGYERLLVQGESGSRAEIAERFRREGDKVLLATRSFWEGFDVAGEALSCVVLAKLPFANFKDPIHAGRQRAIDAEGGSSFGRYSLPQAVMLLKQGFGRLIRSSLDYGCVFLLDSRAVNSSYGKVFIESLPGPRVFSGKAADCLAEARRFMQNAASERQNQDAIERLPG